MTMTDTTRPYEKVRALIKQMDGTMTWYPTGRGGYWEIALHGKTGRVQCPDRSINALDRLYATNVADPQTWDDYDDDAALVEGVEGAFWGLIKIVQPAPDGFK